jgi:hypothetical protein
MPAKEVYVKNWILEFKEYKYRWQILMLKKWDVDKVE